MRNDITGEGQILLQYVCFPTQHIISALQKALVLYEPCEPARAAAVSRLDRPLTIGHRVRGIRNIDLRIICVVVGGLIKRKSLPVVQIEISTNCFLWRPVVRALPLLRTALKG